MRVHRTRAEYWVQIGTRVWREHTGRWCGYWFHIILGNRSRVPSPGSGFPIIVMMLIVPDIVPPFRRTCTEYGFNWNFIFMRVFKFPGILLVLGKYKNLYYFGGIATQRGLRRHFHEFLEAFTGNWVELFPSSQLQKTYCRYFEAGARMFRPLGKIGSDTDQG